MRKLDGFRMLGALALMLFPDRNSSETLAEIFESRAVDPREGQRLMLRYGDRAFTYREADRCVNRAANAYRGLGLRKGDVIALIMENRPEYLWHYLAAGKLGVPIALVNANARGDGLVQAIRAVNPAQIVVGSEVWSRFAEARASLPPALAANAYLDLDPDGPIIADARCFGALTEAASDGAPSPIDPPRLGDLGAHIYTSGTTGTPKAANMSYFRLTNIPRAMAALAWRMQPDDVIYCCLPLHHSNALLVAVGSAITSGASLALARRFSARRFWEDIHRYQATGFNYIGEMCRYLVNTPPCAVERQHRVRAVVGQGLCGEVWQEFQKRFGIGRIVEFYASTEGNIATMNFGGTVGSVGKLLFGGALARWDDDRGDFERGRDSRLVRCRAGEIGVLLGRIRHRTPFEGYRDQDATTTKIIRDAFKPGDAWYNTGDLFRIDCGRNLTFIDRIGDTYRWKGENVATIEVQEQIGKWSAVALANVYGVRVDGIEGRVGAASLVMQPSAIFDPVALARHVDAALPAYARPVFVRLQQVPETTETFKLAKTRLRLEGLDPATCKDPLYFRASGMPGYEPLTPTRYQEILSGRLRL